jgi:hypothetical protein
MRNNNGDLGGMADQSGSVPAVPNTLGKKRWRAPMVIESQTDQTAKVHFFEEITSGYRTRSHKGPS